MYLGKYVFSDNALIDGEIDFKIGFDLGKTYVAPLKKIGRLG